MKKETELAWTYGHPQAWARGTLAPAGNAVKCFVQLAVTVKGLVDQLFMHYFHKFLEGQ